MQRHPVCQDLALRADKVLAGGPGTFSKNPSRYPEGFAPYALCSGEGTYVTGSDGRTYLDTVGALGPILLGYGYPAVQDAVLAQVQRGASFSMVTDVEIRAAEMLVALLPCAEMVRFAKNGTDATNMATRLARVVTGQKSVVFVGYAGGACDSYGITTDKCAGILPEIAPFNTQLTWQDPRLPEAIASARAHGGLACIMAEVPALPWHTSWDVFNRHLCFLRDVAHAEGGLFILDEVVSFPRYDLNGAQAYYDVTPDLCTVSKGIANGYPLAALVGPEEHMARLNDGDIFASWTFAGDTVSLAACLATLDACVTTDALGVIRDLGAWYGETLFETLQSHALPAALYGNYARLAVRWRDAPGVATAQELRTLWMQEHARRGILYGIGVVFPNGSWSDAVVRRLNDTAEEVAELIVAATDRGEVRDLLECPVITDVLSVRG